MDIEYYKYSSSKKTKKKVDSLFSRVKNLLIQDTEKAKVLYAFLILFFLKLVESALI